MRLIDIRTNIVNVSDADGDADGVIEDPAPYIARWIARFASA